MILQENLRGRHEGGTSTKIGRGARDYQASLYLFMPGVSTGHCTDTQMTLVLCDPCVRMIG
jgi:hypothetical protein